ncbi:MucBP domain-containing protein [Listeria ilorinensis]|uniref:MucBP domain-containing protein n=1 Tax=Listeria ilorinensis TaxID=2867439 RepID=UPI001EF47286|nr:MucBP domain-containing protein [Listeria ilorinensis]
MNKKIGLTFIMMGLMMNLLFIPSLNAQAIDSPPNEQPSHVAPTIDWTNWQVRNEQTTDNYSLTGGLNDIPGQPSDQQLNATIKADELIPSMNQGDTKPSGTLSGENLRVRFGTIDPTSFGDLTFHNNRTGAEFVVKGSDITKYAGTMDWSIPAPDLEMDMEDTVSITGTLHYLNSGSAINSVFLGVIAPTPFLLYDAQVVKVYYKNAATGEDLLPNDVLGLGGKIGDTVTGTAKDIPDWTLQSHSLVTSTSTQDGLEPSVSTTLQSGNDNVSANSGDTDPKGKQAIVFWYTPAPAADVTVQYLDESNQPIPGVPSKTISGNIGDTYDTTTAEYRPAIPGYYLDTTNLPENANGKLTDQPQTVIYHYLKNQTAVNVHDSTIYVGDDWTAADNFDSASGKAGENIPLSDIQITGNVDTTKPGSYVVTYSYGGVSASAKITVMENTANSTVTTSYLDEAGNPLADQIIQTGKIGEPYHTKALILPGYELIETPKNADGVFSAQNQSVTYVYKVSASPSISTDDFASPDTTVTSSGDIPTKVTLPKTGDTNSDWLILFGAAAIVGSISLRKHF